MRRQVLMMTLVSCLAGISPALAQEAPGAQDLPVASAGARAEAFDARREPAVLQARPPLTDARITGEILSGALGGGLGATAGLMTGFVTGLGLWALQDPCDDCDDWNAVAFSLGGALAGAVVMYPLGSGIGVALAGNSGNQTGSLGAAIEGSYLGALTGVAAGAGIGFVASLFTDDAGGLTSLLGTAGFLVGAPIGAVIGFNRTRAYDVSPARPPLAGLVSVDEDQAHLSVPVISMTPDPLYPGSVVTSVRLIDARF